jgi:glucose-6-phosphate 1-dehydrogenase
VEAVMESCTIVLFGASGDLTQRMVMPAIFRLARRGLLSPEFRLIGYARTKMTDDEFRARMRKAVMRERALRDEKVKVLRAVRKISPGEVGQDAVRAVRGRRRRGRARARLPQRDEGRSRLECAMS